MKISAVIPTYTLNKDLEKVASITISEIRSKVDEIIIVEDGGMYSPWLQSNSNKYLYHSENVGFTKGVNLGLQIAEGEYIAIVNSDISQIIGEIDDLCIPGRVTSPITKNQDVPLLAGHFFVIPRTVLDERGFLDDSMRMFCSDADYEERIKDIFEQVSTVKILHGINTTLKAADLTNGKQLQKDRETYENICNNSNN